MDTEAEVEDDDEEDEDDEDGEGNLSGFVADDLDESEEE